MIIVKSPCRIAATILARNEEDIIGKTIEHHVNQGVSSFIVTDNRSTDRTRSIVEQYPEVRELIDEPGNDHSQSRWVSRMARIACKLDPDWIVHLDSDELWCGLQNLRSVTGSHVSSTRMYLHPPRKRDFDFHSMRFYLDFDHIPGYVGESKVAHRADPNITITHGNHGFEGNIAVSHLPDLWRHHYPIRSLNQFRSKATEGHRALARRGAICERWKAWNDLYEEGQLDSCFDSLCREWGRMIESPNTASLLSMMSLWSTPETIAAFESGFLPRIGEWPQRS